MNVDEAIKPFDLVIALSARRRDINKKHITMKDFKKYYKQKTKH